MTPLHAFTRIAAPFFALGCTASVGLTEPASSSAQLANPASTYCLQQGGQLTLQKDAAGNASGLCTLPDGTVIDEWALFRRDHPVGGTR